MSASQLASLGSIFAEEAANAGLLALAFELCTDGMHFTEKGFERFARALARSLAHALARVTYSSSTLAVAVVTDSTVGHDGERWAPRLAAAIRRFAGVSRVTVDAVCGSGFVALRDENLHFGARLRSHLPRDEQATVVVVFVGGWNDVRDEHRDEACDEAKNCMALISHHERHGGRRER